MNGGGGDSLVASTVGWKTPSRKVGEEWNSVRLYHIRDILCGFIIALDTGNIDGLNIFVRLICFCLVVTVFTDSHSELYCTSLKNSDVKIQAYSIC
jgi:hypothetical protein